MDPLLNCGYQRVRSRMSARSVVRFYLATRSFVAAGLLAFCILWQSQSAQAKTTFTHDYAKHSFHRHNASRQPMVEHPVPQHAPLHPVSPHPASLHLTRHAPLHPATHPAFVTPKQRHGSSHTR